MLGAGLQATLLAEYPESGPNRMRVSTMIRISPRTHPDSGLIDRITDFGRQVEARGFPGVWVGIRWAAAGPR